MELDLLYILNKDQIELYEQWSNFFHYYDKLQ